jgi:hypothetical protein
LHWGWLGHQEQVQVLKYSTNWRSSEFVRIVAGSVAIHDENVERGVVAAVCLPVIVAATIASAGAGAPVALAIIGGIISAGALAGVNAYSLSSSEMFAPKEQSIMIAAT